MIKLLCIFLISDRFSRPKEIHFSLFTTRSSWRCTESYQRKYPNDFPSTTCFSDTTISLYLNHENATPFAYTIVQSIVRWTNCRCSQIRRVLESFLTGFFMTQL